MSATVKTWAPTRKWWALVAGGLAAIAANLIESGSFDTTERGMLGALLVAATAAYFKQNDDTPGGVPAK